MRITDWRPLIVEMYSVRQQRERVEPGLYPLTLPGVAATAQEVAGLEASLGITLDTEHRSFLTFANGWVCFHQMTTILSVEELQHGWLRDFAAEAFEYDETLQERGWNFEATLPIAVSRDLGDVFLMPIVEGKVGAQVYWHAEGELIDTFDSFQQFFASMILYTKRAIERATSPDA